MANLNLKFASAANIPVNMDLCENLGLNKETYAASIPLGAARVQELTKTAKLTHLHIHWLGVLLTYVLRHWKIY